MTTEIDSAGRPVYTKDPDAVLDYSYDWTAWLGTDTISALSVIGSGVVIDESSHADGVATAWVSGGTLNAKATVTFRVTTAAGRVDDRSIVLKIKDR